MPTCANHHESVAADFCTVCGIEIAPPLPAAPPEPAAGGLCPTCRAERPPGGGEFCEICGVNFKTGKGGFPLPAEEPPPIATPAPALAPASPAQPAPSASPVTSPAATPQSAPEAAPLRCELLATVDLSVTGVPEAEGPSDRQERLFPLDLPEQLIGRRSERRGIFPEISLDPDDSVSHRHATILRQPGGSFAILDLGSSNGTFLNGVELKSHVLTPLQPGDRICLGRWTCLTLRTRR